MSPPFFSRTVGQEEIDSPFFQRESRGPQSFDSIYSQVRLSMELQFGGHVLVSDYNPTESDVYQITVLFDRKDKESHTVNMISSALNEKRLGYFKKRDYGNNDYELPYHEVLVENNLPLNVMFSERYSALHKPSSIETTLDAYSSPLEARRCVARYKQNLRNWAAVDELQHARKKKAYTEKPKPHEDQTVFESCVRIDPNSETDKYFKADRDRWLRSIRNDIVFETGGGMMISEIKSSCEVNDKYSKMVYLQLCAYHAERSFYNDFSTPITLTVPVLPPRKELDVVERAMKDTGRPMAVLCIADRSRFLRETRLGKKELERLSEKGDIEYSRDIDLLNRYARNFSKES